MEKLIEIIKYVIIAIIQGVSEILPISSSAHLSFAYNFLRIDVTNQLNLTIFLHFASSLALIVFFKDLIIKTINGFFKYIFLKDNSCKDSFLLAIYLIIASIPSALVALIFKNYVDRIFTNVVMTCINLIITSIILLIYAKKKSKDDKSLTFKNTFIMGLFQCLAILPGISRSGITLLAAKLNNINLKDSKEFSFLLLLPISVGSFVISVFDLISNPINVIDLSIYLLTMIITFVVTLLSLKFIFNYFNKISFKFYAYYLLLLSFFIICVFHN